MPGSVLRSVCQRFGAACLQQTRAQPHLPNAVLKFISAPTRQLPNVAEESFAVVNLSSVLERCRLWKDTFPDVGIYYPIKVNPDPAILELLAGSNHGFEVASAKEIDSVMQAGGDPQRIIFSHTVKLCSHMRYARKMGVKCSIVDSVEELEKHAEHWPEAQLLLRLKTGRADGSSSKFGVGLEKVQALMDTAKQLGLALEGIHFHVGTLAKDSRPYLQALSDARAVFDMAASSGHQLKVVNMGGGFHLASDLHDPQAKPSFLALAKSLNEGMQRNFASLNYPVTFIAEPGTFLSMPTTSIVTSVVAVKANAIWASESIYGALGAFNWSGYREIVGRSISLLKVGMRGCAESGRNWYPSLPAGMTKVHGMTCDWDDVIQLPVALPPGIAVGDRIIIENMGAYSLACSCDFNGFSFSSMHRLYVYNSVTTLHQSGFRVHYKVAEVPGKGWGIVLKQSVIKGQTVWEFEAEGETHICHTEDSVQKKVVGMDLKEKMFFLNHLFAWSNQMYELIGDCRFMNHSSEPVIGTLDGGKTWVALFDLNVGDEIVDDYSTYSNPDWYVKLCEEHDVQWAGLVADTYD